MSSNDELLTSPLTSGATQLATLCYLRKNNKVLMIHRNKRTKEGDIHSGKWNGLGGKLDIAESPRDCVIREVKEESGLTIFYPKLHGVLTFPNFAKGKDWVVFVYSASDFDGELLSGCEEGEISWVGEEELFMLPLWPGDFYFLPHVLKGKFFEGKFIYDNGILSAHEVTIY